MSRPALTEQQRAEQSAHQRSQILGGLAACIEQKGYAATTIADIAAAARVSKSTLYAHFTEKEDIFLALYSTASDRVIEVIEQTAQEVMGTDIPWRERIRTVLRAYLEMMAAGHDFTRCLLVEAQAVSPHALALRQEVLGRYVESLRRIAASAAHEPLDARLMLGVLGGVNEYMLSALAGGELDVDSVADAASELMATVIVGVTAPITG